MITKQKFNFSAPSKEVQHIIPFLCSRLEIDEKMVTIKEYEYQDGFVEHFQNYQVDGNTIISVKAGYEFKAGMKYYTPGKPVNWAEKNSSDNNITAKIYINFWVDGMESEYKEYLRNMK